MIKHVCACSRQKPAEVTGAALASSLRGSCTALSLAAGAGWGKQGEGMCLPLQQGGRGGGRGRRVAKVAEAHKKGERDSDA